MLLERDDVVVALGGNVSLLPTGERWTGVIGEVLQAAAADSDYVRYAGSVADENEEERPVAVGDMVLVFSSDEVAARTFDQVAQASHLRSELAGAEVSVETVPGGNGLVSYWGYVYRGPVLSVLTLDTLAPQQIAMPEFRTLMSRAAERMTRS
jgi:hypothetical protein